ncbi:hypothetical protein [Ekhidna sp.]|uniref:hypothetical protein n=1 Tax=Ekhidna sp. TaxID=2608089 RepID=UPI0032972036
MLELDNLDIDEKVDYLTNTQLGDNVEAINQIVDLISSTNDARVRNSGALALMTATSKQDEIKKSLFNILKKHDDSDNFGTLVYACSGFDFSNEVKYFINLALTGNAEVRMSTGSVLKKMKMLSDNDLDSAMKEADKIATSGKEFSKEDYFNLISFLKSKMN